MGLADAMNLQDTMTKLAVLKGIPGTDPRFVAMADAFTSALAFADGEIARAQGERDAALDKCADMEDVLNAIRPRLDVLEKERSVAVETMKSMVNVRSEEKRAVAKRAARSWMTKSEQEHARYVIKTILEELKSEDTARDLQVSKFLASIAKVNAEPDDDQPVPSVAKALHDLEHSSHADGPQHDDLDDPQGHRPRRLFQEI